jgi:hypothetical protein
MDSFNQIKLKECINITFTHKSLERNITYEMSVQGLSKVNIQFSI